MPIKKRWTSVSDDSIDTVPEAAGVYELKAFGKLVKIGYAENLQEAIRHDRESSPNYFRYQTCEKMLFGLFRKQSPRQMALEEFQQFEQNDEYDADLPAWNDQYPQRSVYSADRGF